MTIRRRHLIATFLALAVATPLARQATQGQGQPPTQGQTQGRGGQRQQQNRDTTPPPQGTASIGGRVMTADTGRPIKRARVIVSAGGRGSHSTMTDDQGRYSVTGLTAGSYTVTGSKNGFVDSIFGQKRPLQPGTPVALVDAQAATNIDLRLIRGGVITGRVLDEDGEPLARALVTVQRYQYVRGERQLSAAGGDLSDDRGQYRVFALPAGDYYVSATAGGADQAVSTALSQLAAGVAGGAVLGALGGGGGGRGGRGGGPFGATSDPEPSGYAPTYYPGVVSVADAGKVTVTAGQEIVGIDFQVQLVPFANISGIVAGADDVAQVMLVPQAEGGLGLLGGQMIRGRALADGSFSVRNVPPGRYLAIARSGGRWDQKTGTQPITVTGQNLTGVTLALLPGVTVAGNITVESSGTAAPTDYSIFRIDIPDVDPLPFTPGGGGPGGRGAGPNAGGGRADKSGSFEIGDLQAGRHYFTVTRQGGGQPAGGAQSGQWTLKSVSIAGHDVTDQAFELKGGEDVSNVTVVMTDSSTDLSGTVRDAMGNGMEGLTVIVFSTDPQYWRSQSRRIQTSRTGATGAYDIRTLPPGDYQILAVDDVETGEWYDPAYLQKAIEGSTRVTLDEGQKKTLDLRGPSV